MEEGEKDKEAIKYCQNSIMEKDKNKEIGRFEDLEVWKVAMSLAENLYREFSGCRDYSFRDQIQRSAVSIASNIAEGYDRGSNKEFIRYLYIAKGSCAELRTQIYLAQKTNIIDPQKATQFIELTKKISAMLQNLIKVRKERF